MSTIINHTLSNGVRILFEPLTHVQSAAVGLWCNTGSRHETSDEAGITHLIEHMLFKGTQIRTAKQIAESIEGRGGVLNAFTDKESTCYYCRVLGEDVPYGVDVLTDMMLNSKFESEELKREEEVVCEEIKRSLDEPGDHVHELHCSGRWGNHELGKPIIGTESSVRSFDSSHIRSYMDRRYRGDNVLLAIAGNFDADAVLAQAEKVLGTIQAGGASEDVSRPAGTAFVNEVAKDTEQVHFCIGTDALSYKDESELGVLSILDSALGGSMSSRLFQEIREKRGLAYSVGSYSIAYSAGGAFTVYGGTSMKNWSEVQQLVRAEFDKVIRDGLEQEELDRIKRMLAGNLVLALEGMSSRMMRMSRSQLNYGRERTIEETLEKLRAVTNDQIKSLAGRILSPDRVSTTAIGPFATK